MAEELWKEVFGSLDAFFPKNSETIAPFIKKIGEAVSDPTKLLQPILELVNLLSKE